MEQHKVTSGSRAVVISGQAKSFSARLYVNCTTDALGKHSLGDATLVARNFTTLAGATRWANRELAA